MNKCQAHSGSITHICCCRECLQLLCGKCVVEHLSLHKKKNTWPELYTLEELRSLCRGKLEEALEKSDFIFSEVEKKRKDEMAVQVKINEEFIYLLRKKISSYIEEYFQRLEGYALRECDRISGKVDNKLTELSAFQNCLQHEMKEIDNTQKFEGLLKVFQANYESNLREINMEFQDLLKEKYLIAFKESNLGVFRGRLFELINEVLMDNINARDFSNNLENSKIVSNNSKTKNNQSENKIDEPSPEQNQKRPSSKNAITTANKSDGAHKSLELCSNHSLKQENKSEKNFSERNFPEASSKRNSLQKMKVSEVKATEETKVSTHSMKKSLQNLPQTQDRGTESVRQSHQKQPSIKDIKKSNDKNPFLEPLPLEEEAKIPRDLPREMITETKTDIPICQENTDPKNTSLNNSLSNIPTGFEITLSDYFSHSPNPKYLHYFEENSKNVFLLDIEKFDDPSTLFEKKELSIDFLIPLRSRSTVTPEGLIYLLGGYFGSNLTNTYLYDSFNNTLQPKAQMNYVRESFGVAHMLGQIYVCGGSDEFGNKLNSCERYDLFSNTWMKLAPMNQKASGLYLTAFSDKFIYKFGGESTQTVLSQIIEVYDLKANKWSVVQAMSETNLVPVISRLGACSQINDQHILIFGGYYAKNDAGTNQSFLLETGDKEKQKYIIKRLNEKLLPHCAGFWCNMPIIYKKKLICLQNVSDPDNKSVSLPDRRRVLCFDGYEWKKLK